jgi:iron complex transport system permease protein
VTLDAPVRPSRGASNPPTARTRPRHLVLRTRRGARARIERRTAVVCLVLAVLTLAAAVVGLTVGDYPLSAADVVRGLFVPLDDPFAVVTLRDLRIPRVLGAVLVGAALGASGAILQSISGNPLGSPDVVGFTTGAATGALVQIIILGAGPDAVALGAVGGGLAAAGLMYALAYRDGASGYRLVLVGIGLAAMLQALNTWLIVRADLNAAQVGAQWLAGTLNAVTWGEVVTILAVVAVLLPLTMLTAGRDLSVLTLGDPVAIALGLPAERARRRLVLASLLLVAVATAITGPIAFVALAAPQLARRLTRTATPGMGAAALMGALLVLVSDIVAQRVFAPTQLPVGVVTGSLGGCYLIWLLSREWRGRRG